MGETPAQLSAVALQLAGHVGQTALDRIAASGIAAIAELDQHIAAVQAELAVCQEPLVAAAQLTGRTPSRKSGRASRRGRRGRGDRTSDLQTRLAMLRSGTVTCPDVPFVSNALQAESTLPVELLLHYACGFVEAGVSSGWWPAESADATDWVSLRLAAICRLIIQAEAAAEVHPDLRASAKQD